MVGFSLGHTGNRSLGGRYVLGATGDWVRDAKEWPANIAKT